VKDEYAWAHEDSKDVREDVKQPGQDFPEKACLDLLEFVVVDFSSVERDLEYRDH